MNRITKTLALAGLVLPIITSSCKKDTLPDNSIASARSDQQSLQRQQKAASGCEPPGERPGRQFGQHDRSWR